MDKKTMTTLLAAMLLASPAMARDVGEGIPIDNYTMRYSGGYGTVVLESYLTDCRHARFDYDGKDLSVALYHVTAGCSQEALENLRYSLTERDGSKKIGIHFDSVDNSDDVLHGGGVEMCVDLYFTLPDFPPGKYCWDTYACYADADYRIKHFELRKGEPATVWCTPENDQDILTLRQGVEWVYRNSATGEIYRLRIDGKEYFRTGHSYDPDDMWRVYLYKSLPYERENAQLIGYMRQYHGYVSMYPADTEIESGFWASGLEHEFINPRDNIKFDSSYWQSADRYERNLNVYQFNQPFRFFSNNVLSGAKEDICVAESSVAEVNGSAANLVKLTNGGVWLAGVGAIGDGYASNLIYPVYSLPEGCEPTTFLYLRDLNTGEVIYGSDEDDPGLGQARIEGVADAGTAAIFADGGRIGINIGEEAVLSVYSLSGVLLAKAAGSGCICIDSSNFRGEVVVARAVTESGCSTARLLVR